MTQKEVQDALISHLTTQLSSYANLLVTYSSEAALAAYKKGHPVVLVAPGDGERQVHPPEDKWIFYLDATRSQQNFAQTSPVAAQNADRLFVADVREAINGNAGFAALTAAGLEMSKVENMKDDQAANMSMVNPHVFYCSTF